MVDAFCSVYTKDYRFTRKDDEPKKSAPCSLIDSGHNFLPEKDSRVIYNPKRDDEVIKGLSKNRLQSIYQLSYRHPESRAAKSEDPFSDEFMNYFNKEYGERSQAVLRPPDTSYRINGYSRFSWYYTGRSTYQDDISMEGYKMFKKNEDRGISRLFPGKRVNVDPQGEEELTRNQ